MLLYERITRATGLPILVSGIKVRKAGFADCCDTLESFMFWLRRIAETRLLPAAMTAAAIPKG
jgi:hypothetical protein